MAGGITELIAGWQESVQQFAAGNSTAFMIIVLAVLAWKLVWYGLAAYQSIERKQKTWFVVLFVCAFMLNDLGLLPILYLVFTRTKKKAGRNR